ncbi:hypothetical protein [Candidatus Protofrankia californiensis]|uniref:PIN-like domain-containing protein n=1 Tax=Candidatus Protofrankia californiensis TaxID=1839754 RepID=UPI003D348C55
MRPDVTYPGDPGGIVHKRQRPPCPITTPSTPDHEWIPITAQRGWLAITQDSRIQENRADQCGPGNRCPHGRTVRERRRKHVQPA